MVRNKCVIALSCCQCQCQDEGRDSGPLSSCCHQGGDGILSVLCCRCVVTGWEGEGASALLSGRGRWQRQGHIIVVREREMVMARIHCQHHCHRREGVGEGHIIVREEEG